MAEGKKKVPKRIAQTVIGSLKGGVVPRIGLPYITVGRKNEIEALLHDVEVITEGGASFRFIVGRYGSGKSFLIQTIRHTHDTDLYMIDRQDTILFKQTFPACIPDIRRKRRSPFQRSCISTLASSRRSNGVSGRPGM